MKRNPIDITVISNVRAEIARRGLSQAKLARDLGWNQQALSRRLTGATSFSIRELDAVAEALRVPVTTLIREPEAAV